VRSCRARTRWISACCCIVATLGACTADGEPGLDQVRKGAERYRDVRNAIADGYTTDGKCVTAEMLGFPADQGAMGLHYVRRDLLGLPDKPKGRVAGTGTYTDFAKPAMLVYEPQANGSLQLVAVENLVFKKAWEAAGNTRPPSFRGNPYLLLADDPATPLDEAHGFDPHYELHAWVFRDNPLGMFAPFSPTVTCRHHKPAAAQPAQAPMHSAAAAVPMVDAARAGQLVRSGALMVDVREPSELAESGWLQGAVNRPMSSFKEQAATLPRDRAIVLYCRTGRRSRIAGDVLKSLGFTQVYNLGGFEAAAAAGMATVTR
jgi:rhodanese-related sulfurtransferase